MDVWTLPVGHAVDLETPPLPGTSDQLTDLALVRQVIDLIAKRLGGVDDSRVDGLTWYPTDTAPGALSSARLRLVLFDRSADQRYATIRVYTVDGNAVAGNGIGRPLVDLRLRNSARGQGGDGRPRRDAAELLTIPVTPGESIHRRYEVTESMLTDHVPNRPPVLTTPDLIALVENTAADLLRPRFVPGAASVGTWIGVRHTGPARLGEWLDVEAHVADVRGRRVLFDVRAAVADRPVGDGQIAQTLIRTG